MAHESYTGKVVVITGAASGIGRATAQLFARKGAKVHLCDIDLVGLAETSRLIVAEGGRAEVHCVDVTDADSVAALADRVYAQDGVVDVLHNNAGIAKAGPVEEMSLDDWRRIVDINLMGVVHGVHAFVPRMLAQGRPAHIVNTASGAGLIPLPMCAAYTMTKFGVVGLTETLNAELAHKGIRVTALCPGPVDTPILNETFSGGFGNLNRVANFYRVFGGTAEGAAKSVLRAVDRKKLFATPAGVYVVPPWVLHRISPSGYQLLARLAARLSPALSGASNTAASPAEYSDS